MPELVPILFTIPNFITAGSGRAMLDIIERLDPTRFSPSVCVLKKGGSLDKEVERLGIPFFEKPFTVPIRPYSTLLWRAHRAARPFRSGRYALWHSFHYSDDYTEPIIARMAGVRDWIYWKKNMGWGSRAWYLRSLLATRIIALNTDMVRDFFGSIIFSRKVNLIHLGVDTAIFHPKTPARLSIRQQLNIPADAIMAGCAAHLVPVKGHPTLLAAAAKTPGLHVCLAGKPLDQEYTESLRQQAHSLGIQNRIHFLGGITDIPAFLTELDLFVFPSRMEGCPVALLEAMSSGRACLATDIPGSRDLIEHGKSGLLVPPENVESLAAALHQLSSSPQLRRQLATGARERVLQRFTLEKEVQAHVAVYEEILKGSRFNK